MNLFNKLTGSESWNILLLSASSDYVSYIALKHLGFNNLGTFLWLPAHTTEKYLKSFLKKKNKSTNGGHDLMKLWKRAYPHFSNQAVLSDYKEFIRNINDNIKPHIRYNPHHVIHEPIFSQVFIRLGNELRKEILENEYEDNRTFGLTSGELGGGHDICGNSVPNEYRQRVADIIAAMIMTDYPCR